MFFKKKWKEEDFWNWFSEHEERLFSLDSGSEHFEKTIGEIGRKLALVNRDLEFELLLTANADGKKDFFISAGGVKDFFPAVEAMFQKAPTFEKWNIVKFKQRKQEVGEIRLGDKSFDENTIFFALFDDEPGKVGVHLFFENFQESLFNIYGQVGFIFLDGLLGEYDVSTKVGQIDFRAKDSVDASLIKPIKFLSQEFDRRV